jgi:hypothetical protein
VTGEAKVAEVMMEAAMCYNLRGEVRRGMRRLSAMLFVAASLTAGTRVLPDQTIDVPKTHLLFTKLRFQHSLGVAILHGEIVNQGDKNVTSLRILMTYSDRNGPLAPARGPVYLTVAEAPPNEHLKFNVDVPKDASGRRADADTLSVIFKYDPDPNQGPVLDVDALTALGCPVQMITVNPHHATLSGTEIIFELMISYRNIGGKTIVAEKFGANFFDVTRDGQRSAWNYTSSDVIRPGGLGVGHWDDRVYIDELGETLKAEAWPIKLLFSDGSAWQDDGKEKCKFPTIK